MKKARVIVAECSRARIFSTPGPRGELLEIEGLTQPEARLKEHDPEADIWNTWFEGFYVRRLD